MQAPGLDFAQAQRLTVLGMWNACTKSQEAGPRQEMKVWDAQKLGRLQGMLLLTAIMGSAGQLGTARTLPAVAGRSVVARGIALALLPLITRLLGAILLRVIVLQGEG